MEGVHVVDVARGPEGLQSPNGEQRQSPGRGPGDEVPQKLKNTL